MPDIAVNPASQITAAQWVAMIKRSPYVPREIKQDLTARGNTIVGPAKIRTPAGTISGWRDDFAAAFASRHWEITTAQENFALIERGTEFHVHRTFILDIQRGEVGPGHWMKTGPNQREWSSYRTEEITKLGQSEFLFGWTFSSEEVNKKARKGEPGHITLVKSKRALIIIVNRMVVVGVPTHDHLIASKSPALSQFSLTSMFPALSEFIVTSRQFTVPEDKLVASFLHEIGAHAGRMSQGLGSLHGDAIVEDNVTAIEGLFPKDTTLINKVQSALVEADGHAKGSRLRASAKGRTPGPQQGGPAQGRTPGPQR